MGALASQGQRNEIRRSHSRIYQTEADVVFGGNDDFEVVDADAKKGAFCMPTLLHCEKPLTASRRAFGRSIWPGQHGAALRFHRRRN